MKKVLYAAVAAALASGAMSAQAYEQGDWILRVGAATVAPNESSDNIILPTSPPTVLKGVSVSDDTQVGLIGAYLLTDTVGLELLASTPFEHDISIRGTSIDAGSAKHLPPTLSLQWYPRGGQDGWQPYLGMGVNYTIFFDEEVDPDLEDALGAIIGATDVDLELKDSVGLSAQAGIDFPITQNLSLNLGVWYIDLGTTATIKTDVGRVKFDVDIDPWVYNFGIAYRF
jgi:outer membrane protein